MLYFHIIEYIIKFKIKNIQTNLLIYFIFYKISFFIKVDFPTPEASE